MSPTLYTPSENVFDFDDVMLVPNQCVVTSRKEVDVTTQLGKHTWRIPVVPANMSSVVDENTARTLLEERVFYIMHRFNLDTAQFIRNMQADNLITSISIGVQPADYDLITSLYEENLTPDYVTIDIAHGDTETVIGMASHIKDTFGDETYVIAGNIATSEAAIRYAQSGVIEAVKVGVAPGAACLTGPNTGFGSRGWQLSAVANVAEALKDSSLQIIADGGIRKPGDIAKAVAFGADFVMIGSMFAGHEESPGEILLLPETGEKVKAYYGSASAEQKGNNTNVEGLSMTVPYRGLLKDTVEQLEGHLQSSVSYAGGTDLNALKQVNYVKIR